MTEQHHNSDKRMMLLVDDDVLSLGLLNQFLQRVGYDTRLATSGQMALDILAETEREPDLALLDIGMPGMSGLELAKRLQAETAIPVMFISASDDDEIARQAAECGAVGFLVKPIEMSHVSPAVTAALARAAEIRQLRASESKLTIALRSGRETGIAIGLLMERYKIDRESAFKVLHDYARSNRRKINDVALELLSAAEALNSFVHRVAELPRIK